ncbi:MAG: hypothetical protein ACRELT_03215, partial [Longimicrobiales bacterium]
RGGSTAQAYRYLGANDLDLADTTDTDSGRVALVLEQRGQVSPVSRQSRARTGDTVHFLMSRGVAAPAQFELVREIEHPGRAEAGTPGGDG